MSEPWTTARSAISGPTLSFAFNLAKQAGQGEDSDPILRDGPDLGLVGVFDGMGGAGGTVYDTPDGPHTGAYLASRIAREVVERRMLDLLEPNWNLNGFAAADDLQRSVRQALEERLADLKAPPSRLRSKLLRALPTTMATVALQRTQHQGPAWSGHVFWAGDSRAYVLTRDGLQQLSTDDLRDPDDAMANLHRDSVVSNAMSADTEFHVSYRRVALQSPFVVISATDGCFGYLPTPMHFEHLVLKALAGARNAESWSCAVQKAITAVTGDDAAMGLIAVGTGLKALQSLCAPRLTAVETDFVTPADQLRLAVREAEQALDEARKEERRGTAQLWQRYRPEYEHFLHELPLDDSMPSGESADHDPADQPDDSTQPDQVAAEPSQAAFSDEIAHSSEAAQIDQVDEDDHGTDPMTAGQSRESTRPAEVSS